ncbi:hypothetical protein SNEBB_002749 [Seison nebaliae]|nr:hypothetical protein SNEBB_002749 [Seison nebaliae]
MLKESFETITNLNERIWDAMGLEEQEADMISATEMLEYQKEQVIDAEQELEELTESPYHTSFQYDNNNSPTGLSSTKHQKSLNPSSPITNKFELTRLPPISLPSFHGVSHG